MHGRKPGDPGFPEEVSADTQGFRKSQEDMQDQVDTKLGQQTQLEASHVEGGWEKSWALLQAFQLVPR